MKHTWRAVELGGEVDQQGRLSLDVPLPVRGPRKVQVVVLLLEETHRPDYAEEHTEGESSAQPADRTLTVWHDFRISRAEHTKLITLGFLEGTIPNKPMR